MAGSNGKYHREREPSASAQRGGGPLLLRMPFTVKLHGIRFMYFGRRKD